MISTEDRARAAMQAIGNTVRDAPPLELTPAARDLPAADAMHLGGHRARRRRLPRPGGAARPDRRGWHRRWRSRLAPIAAAVAVAAVAIALVTIRDIPNGRVASPSPSTTSVAPAGHNAGIPGVPQYYVAWRQVDAPYLEWGTAPGKEVGAGAPYLVVGDTATGKQVGEVTEPPGVYLEGIYGAAADDRTFVVMGDRLIGPPGQGRAVFYLLRIDPGGRTPARLTALPIPVHQNPAGVAISPDGTELAVASAGSPATLRVYSISTGKVLRSWSATVPGAVEASISSGPPALQFTAATVLRWSSDGRRLAFGWDSTAIRVLDVSTPDGNLITSSSVLAAIGSVTNQDSSVTCNASQGWELISGGQSGVGQSGVGQGVICGGSAQAGRPTTSAACAQPGQTFIGFLKETRGGQGNPPVSLVDKEPDCSTTALAGAYIGWANADGSIVIGSLLWDGHERFGVFRDGRFTALPALPISVQAPAGVLLGTYDW